MKVLRNIGLLFMPLLAWGNDNERDIRALLTSTWDQPNAPLNVLVVVSENDVAIADWLQGQKGGRALLQKHRGAWQVVLCGGDGLKSSAILAQTGINDDLSQKLLRRLSESESTLSESVLKQLSNFGGEILMPSAHQSHQATH